MLGSIAKASSQLQIGSNGRNTYANTSIHHGYFCITSIACGSHATPAINHGAPVRTSFDIRCGRKHGRWLTPPTCRKSISRGTTSIELLVSFTLLTAVMGMSVPLVVRHGRLLTSARHYRCALDELTNQAELLSSRPSGEIAGLLKNLSPSEFAKVHLPGAEIKGELSPVENGERLTLRIVWNEVGRRQSPLTLATWILSNARQTNQSRADGDPR